MVVMMRTLSKIMTMVVTMTLTMIMIMMKMNRRDQNRPGGTRGD